MNVLNWLRNWHSGRGKALSRYRQGMERAKRQDHAGAIDDYTATINMPHVPLDVKAMALFNRALILSSDGDNPLARDDLNTVLAMAETPPEVRIEARRKLVRMERQSSRTDEHENATTDRPGGATPADLRSRHSDDQSH
jgi:hypothetical protein